MQHQARHTRRSFPHRPGLTFNPDARSRLELGRRLGIDPGFVLRQFGIAHDTDGDSLVVRGEACGYEDSFFAIPSDPSDRHEPELDGELPLSVWHASECPFRDAPAVIGLDLETVSAGEGSGCPASMLCVPAPCLAAWSAADWSDRLQQGAACSILERHHEAKAMILASNPDNPAGTIAIPALAAELRELGYAGPILELPQVDLGRFVFSGLPLWDRVAALVGEARLYVRSRPVSLDDLLPAKPCGQP